MNVAEALRSIRYDLLEYIQKNVRVDFDNALQMPVTFTYRRKRYGISEIFGRFRTQSKYHLNGYLVRADDNEVYFLYFHFLDSNSMSQLNIGCWVLSFRVLNDRELMAFYREERKTNDLALDATLRAAALYQQRRNRHDAAIAVEDSDIREKIREKRIGNFIVFVVDASGSMGAGKRMIETKGAILSLLLNVYQKRDKVAMVAFKEDRAEVLLPPTSSIELAHKLLEELPVGGKTPLCHGISLGYQIIQSYFRKDPHIYPLLILISDGKANVSQYGGKPVSEAMEVAEEIKNDTRINTAVVDVEKPGLISFGLAHQLSVQMGARYFKIEDLKADTLVKVLQKDLLV